jgi:hypothetical protein
MRDGGGRFVVIATGFGLLALMLFEGSRYGAKTGSAWPTVRGKVVDSGTESYRARVNKTRVTSYAPVVEYAYVVNGHEYRSRQIKLDESASDETQVDAEKIAARYPKDNEVEVHYDPASPGNAALERPTGIAWYLLAVAAVCFGAAIYAAVTR